ncbi:HAD family acid phosphatase [Kitasatospora sp. NPDC050543]|uniref:HAD family acid phosphatase n=1 Tax=Kitasatospora sp. NPDC050543 TaxID=3364054 RepID=UPI0037B593BE
MIVPTVVAGVLALGFAAPATAAPAAAAPAVAAPVAPAVSAPTSFLAASVTESQWLSDVRAAIAPARTWIEQRSAAAAASGERPAIVFDIDNTTLQTHFHPFLQPAIPSVLELARFARSRGVAIIFVTARPDFIEELTEHSLQHAGYTVDGLYGRDFTDLFEPVQDFKTDKRIEVEQQGYTIIANIGNNTTDLVGGHAERTFKLPDYNGLLS